MSEYFPKPESLGANVKFELDLSNYATKADFKNATRLDASSFAKNTDLANIKSDVDKLDYGTLKNVPTNLNNLKSKENKLGVDNSVPVPVDLNKLSEVVKNHVVKKDVFNAKIKNFEDKIPDTTRLATNTALNAKINKNKNEIPSINNLATTTVLTTVENKIPNVSALVKKSDFDRKISEMGKRFYYF